MIQAPPEPIPNAPGGGSASGAVETKPIVEFVLRDLATIRLLQPSPADVAAFRERLGPPVQPTAGTPDLCFRFTERLPLPPNAGFVGEEAAFTQEQFFLRRSRSRESALACLPLDRVGQGGEILVPRGTEPPLLDEILNLCVLQRGGLALHASTFEFEGRGCAVGGWPHGGKTAVLIGMMAAGARFVSDDWTFLHADGVRLSGLPGLIEVRERYLRAIPEFHARVPGNRRARASMLRTGAGAARVAARLAPPARRLAARAAHALEERQKLRLAPSQLFGPDRCLPETGLDHFLFCVASGQPEVEIQTMSLPEAVTRILASLEFERRKLRSYYLQFRFAFPDRLNPLLEQAPALEEERLHRALEGRGLFLLRHAPLAAPGALAEALAPLLRMAPTRASGERTG